MPPLMTWYIVILILLSVISTAALVFRILFYEKYWSMMPKIRKRIIIRKGPKRIIKIKTEKISPEEFDKKMEELMKMAEKIGGKSELIINEKRVIGFDDFGDKIILHLEDGSIEEIDGSTILAELIRKELKKNYEAHQNKN